MENLSIFRQKGCSYLSSIENILIRYKRNVGTYKEPPLSLTLLNKMYHFYRITYLHTKYSRLSNFLVSLKMVITQHRKTF